MNNENWTKGEWLMDRNNCHVGHIATIHHCKNNDWIEIWSPDWPDSEEEQEANAFLMWAAKDMADALLQWQAADRMSDPGELENAERARDKALSKARGES